MPHPDPHDERRAESEASNLLGSFSPELVALASDAESELEERLEAYEDLLDSEIGDTSLSRARHLEREQGLRQIYLKFEGGNPTGTQKDRIAFALTMDALRRGFETVTVATCGNYGVALALAARAAGLACRLYIPESYHTRRVAEMTACGAEIVRVAGDYEGAVEASKEEAERRELYDANPGGANTVLQLLAYAEIAFEIYDHLRDAPAAIAVPVSNGTTLAGIHRGFLRLNRRGKTSRMPRMVAGSSYKKNPIVHAIEKNLPTCEDLAPARIRESAVNEPLINWHASEGDYALEAVRTTNGWGRSVSDRAMTQLARRLKDEEGLSVLPASTAGLAAFVERHREEALPGDRYVAILTGRRR